MNVGGVTTGSGGGDGGIVPVGGVEGGVVGGFADVVVDVSKDGGAEVVVVVVVQTGGHGLHLSFARVSGRGCSP